jgi:hypothetical protein
LSTSFPVLGLDRGSGLAGCLLTVPPAGAGR